MNIPPFALTSQILNSSMEITRLLGVLDGISFDKPKITLRKENAIRTIHSSLAIEGNTLSLAQVSDILEGTPVIGDKNEILEVKNAIALYKMFGALNYRSLSCLNKAHGILMGGLIKSSGKLRTNNVGIFKGSKVAHVAPSHKMIPKLMRDLFSYIKRKDDISLLIKSCIFHYELEFIHPFEDGNGRMGRFWQHLILTAYHPVFEFVSIESLIKARQNDYYHALSKSDENAESTVFIEFILEIIKNSLLEYTENIQYQPKTPEDRLEYAKQHLKNNFTRKDYNNVFKNISTATASRDLNLGVRKNILIKQGDKRLTTYYFNHP